MKKQSNGNGNGKLTLTRRDFLKVSAAAGAGGGMLGLAGTLQSSSAVGSTGTAATITRRAPTTCACCSVGCGQIVDVDGSGNVIDVHGDPNHVTNRGALCPKGSASVQWVNGDRRLGLPGNTLGITGPVYRQSNINSGAWTAYASWDSAVDDVATRLYNARNSSPTGTAMWSTNYVDGRQSKSVAFLGCSHATNEENWVYRKLIANLGTNNTEHQARI